MTEQEKINSEVQMKLALQDAKFNQFMEATKERDKERAEDMREIRNSVRSMQQSLMEMQTSNRNQNVLVIIGVAAMVIAVILK